MVGVHVHLLFEPLTHVGLADYVRALLALMVFGIPGDLRSPVDFSEAISSLRGYCCMSVSRVFGPAGVAALFRL